MSDPKLVAENEAAFSLLSMIFRVIQRLRTFGFALSKIDGVESTTWSQSILHVPPVEVTFDLSAELKNGDALSWVMLVSYSDGKWWVTPDIHVYINRPRSQEETLFSFGVFPADNLGECEKIFDRVLNCFEASFPVAAAVANAQTKTIEERLQAAQPVLDVLDVPDIKAA